VAEATTFIGRSRETELAVNGLKRGSNILVQGKTGIGKSAFLQHVREEMGEQETPIIWVGTGTAKPVIDDVARQLHEQVGLRVPKHVLGRNQLIKAKAQGLTWDQLKLKMSRMAVKEKLAIISDTLLKKRCLFFIETLEVPPTLADAFAVIIEQAQVIAAMDDNNRRARIQKLLWKFQQTIHLKPLTLEESEAFTRQALNRYSVRFDKHATEERFIRHVARSSGGIPTAINTMVEGAGQEDEITPSRIRRIGHEAGTTYFDMTPFLILALVILMAMRYIGRGIGEMEMMIMSGIGMALFMGLRMLMWSIRK
jgi:hypothetical protein